MRPRAFVGIDHGKHGGIAVIDPNCVIYHLAPIPVATTIIGRTVYHVPSIVDIFQRFALGFDLDAVVERLHPLPMKMGGSIANYERGTAQAWGWMFEALGIHCDYVLPQQWQKVILGPKVRKGDTKTRSIAVAKRLFPGVDLRPSIRARNDSDGLADALCIAAFCGQLRSNSTLGKRNPANLENQVVSG